MYAAFFEGNFYDLYMGFLYLHHLRTAVCGRGNVDIHTIGAAVSPNDSGCRVYSVYVK